MVGNPTKERRCGRILFFVNEGSIPEISKALYKLVALISVQPSPTAILLILIFLSSSDMKKTHYVRPGISEILANLSGELANRASFAGLCLALLGLVASSTFQKSLAVNEHPNQSRLNHCSSFLSNRTTKWHS